jgi:hypothetical protein
MVPCGAKVFAPTKKQIETLLAARKTPESLCFLAGTWRKQTCTDTEADVYRNHLDSFICQRRSRREKKKKESGAPAVGGTFAEPERRKGD